MQAFCNLDVLILMELDINIGEIQCLQSLIVVLCMPKMNK